MTTPTSNLQYSWSLDLRQVLPRDPRIVSSVAVKAGLILATGIGSRETETNGPTTLHFFDIPNAAIDGLGATSEVVVLEVSSLDDLTVALLRPAWVGSEPCVDTVFAGVGS
jgi:hypothetical protein